MQRATWSIDANALKMVDGAIYGDPFGGALDDYSLPASPSGQNVVMINYDGDIGRYVRCVGSTDDYFGGE